MSKHILAIDDSPTLRKFIVKSLSSSLPTHEMSTAANAQEGLKLAKNKLPEVILLDYILPDQNGDVVCERLLEDAETASIPVILMSSSASEIREVETRFRNIRRSIAKPFTPELLCASVNFVLRELEKERAAAAPPPPPEPAAPEETETPASAPHASLFPAAPLVPTSKPVFNLPPAQPGVYPPKSSPLSTTQKLLGRQSANLAPTQLVFCGSTDFLPMINALRGIEENKLTGVLRINLFAKPLELFFQEGRAILATTRDVAAYLQGSRFNLPTQVQPIFEGCRNHQQLTGCPIFLRLREKELLESDEEAQTLVHQYGTSLFAKTWTAAGTRFEFESLAGLPEYASNFPPPTPSVDDWALDSLRNVGNECLSALAWGEPDGLPSYTRSGYERVQQILLTQEEVDFINIAGSGQTSLRQAAEALHIELDHAHALLYRFMCLQILDYWPSYQAKETS
jgi:CheY-like chemotaxis protein